MKTHVKALIVGGGVVAGVIKALALRRVRAMSSAWWGLSRTCPAAG